MHISPVGRLSMQDKLRARSMLLQQIRAFFSARDVLEITTPILSQAGTTDPNIGSLKTRLHMPGGEQSFYLHTSPEFSMKRALAAGSGSIFQLCPVFRDSDLGRYHRPEFTMLEWYRVGFDHRQLMTEVEALLACCLPAKYCAKPPVYQTYRQAILQFTGLELRQLTSLQCRKYCQQQNLLCPDSMSEELDEWLDLLISHFVMPNFERDRLVFIYDYPASQAALSKLREDQEQGMRVAERFEVFAGGIELANGFHELTDPDEQLRRFEQDNCRRAAQGKEAVTIDRRLIAALSQLPQCAGVALGVDRLLMLRLEATHIDDVMWESLY